MRAPSPLTPPVVLAWALRTSLSAQYTRGASAGLHSSLLAVLSSSTLRRECGPVHCTHWAPSSICSARPLGSTWAAPSCTSPENSLKAASPGNHGFTTFVSPSRGSLVSTAWCPASIPPLARCSAVAGQRVNPVSVSLSQRKAEICPDVSDVALLLLLGQEWRQTLLSGWAGKANKQHWPLNIGQQLPSPGSGPA